LHSRSGRSERRAEVASRADHRQRAEQTAKWSIGSGLSGVLSADSLKHRLRSRRVW
jgi:uncharacterized membrane protein